MMDHATDALLHLLSTSTKQLQSLYTDIGDPGCTYQDAIAELHGKLTSSIQTCLQRAHDRKEEILQQCRTAQKEILELDDALGTSTQSSLQPDSATDASLFQRHAKLVIEWNNLKGLHAQRAAEAQVMQERLKEHEIILGDRVETPTRPLINKSGSIYPPLPLSYLSALSTELARCDKELSARTEQLQTHLLDILDSWSVLHMAPDPVHDEFDAQILTHLQVRPLWHMTTHSPSSEAASFHGEFERFVNSTLEADAFAPPEPLQPTPTRKSNGSSGEGENTPRCLEVKQRALLSEKILPTSSNLQRVASRRATLESEKANREARIQGLYDELSELWMQFDAPQDEMEEFVQGNCGSTLEVIEAYQRELQKMQELKKEHMSLFIEKVRERIRRLWDTLRLSDAERRESFPECFEENASASEEMLALHESAIASLSNEVETKSPVLEVIARYQAILDEEKQMEEDAKDPNRYKNTRGDPGRLLREEKTRKRIKVQKPKLQQELLKVVPEWETQHDKQFTIDGDPYLATLKELTAGTTRDTRKRNRTISNTSNTSAQDHPTLTSSTAHNRTAATPARVPSTPGVGSTVKRPKLASSVPPSTVRQRQPPPSTTASVRTVSRAAGVHASSKGLRPPTTSSSAASSGKFRAPSSFRPRPSAVLQTYVTTGGGRPSAEGPTDEQASVSRTASHSSSGTVIEHSIRPLGSFGAPSSRMIAGPNWTTLEEE